MLLRALSEEGRNAPSAENDEPPPSSPERGEEGGGRKGGERRNPEAALPSSCGFSGLACFKLSCIRQHRTTLMQIMQNIQKPPIPIKYCSILPIVCILFTLLLSIDSK